MQRRVTTAPHPLIAQQCPPSLLTYRLDIAVLEWSDAVAVCGQSWQAVHVLRLSCTGAAWLLQTAVRAFVMVLIVTDLLLPCLLRLQIDFRSRKSVLTSGCDYS